MLAPGFRLSFESIHDAEQLHLLKSGYLECLFPRVAIRFGQKRFRTPLKWLKRQQTPLPPGRFRHPVDWLFCLLFPEHTEPCESFYRDEGPPLQNLIDEDEQRRLDKFLVVALRVLREREQQDFFGDWDELRREIELRSRPKKRTA